MRKLRKLDRQWMIGFALTNIGFDLHDVALKEGFRFDGNVYAYMQKLREVYERFQYLGRAGFLLAGIQDGQPCSYISSLERNDKEAIVFNPPTSQPTSCAIGANHHGALYLADAYNNESLTPEQRVLLAYFIVREVAHSDPRVGEPIEIVLFKVGADPKEYTPEELGPFHRKSKHISSLISRTLSQFRVV